VDRDRLLTAVSTAQLTVGVAGMAVAVKRHHAYDAPLLHGQPDRVALDTLLMGTALSAPGVMLAAQGWAVARLLRGSPNPARVVLGGLGAIMIAGYFAERLVRRRLRPSNWDAVESPLAATGITLAATMAILGLTPPRSLAEARVRTAPTTACARST
jgi:hypothetical protein